MTYKIKMIEKLDKSYNSWIDQFEGCSKFELIKTY